MILAAAACAAAGISYIFHDDEQSPNTKYETVTASSTIIDQQGIVKYVIHPRLISPYALINQEQKSYISMMDKSKSNRLELPIGNKKEKNNFKQDFSVVFFWSIPLKTRLLQTPTKSSRIIENINPFQRHLMKISIGIQNERIENIPSEIALSNSNESLDSLSYNPIINDHIIPIGILKKKKLDVNEGENNQKKFCFAQNEFDSIQNLKIFDSNEENTMRNITLQNVNLCVENLSKILSESCSNTDEQLTTLHNSSSLISAINNNQEKSSIIQDQNKHSKLFKHEEDFTSNQFSLHHEKNDREHLSDGIILHRGRQFGITLGEPMIRKSDQNLLINSSHSINELNRLLSTTNCILMRKYQIETIEDLIRLFLQQGSDRFTELMIHLFQVNPLIVQQLNIILRQWAKQWT